MRRIVSIKFMFFAIMLMLFQPVQANAYDVKIDDTFVCMNATQKIEKEFQIKEHLLTTIASVESGKWNESSKQNVAWPWTINAEGKGMFFKTKAEAIAKVKSLQAKGVKSIDVGCMQINLSYHGDAFKNLDEAFDPEKNVRYGATFLKKLYSKKGDWIKAAMAYHSSVPHKAERYKKKIAYTYEVVKTAYNNAEAKLFADKELSKRIKIAKMEKEISNQINVAKTYKKSSKTAKLDANAWREARLREYQEGKIK